MPTFHIEVERTQRVEFWITCDDEDTAEEAAEILADDFRDWDEVSAFAHVAEVVVAPSGEPHWIGGEDGHWADNPPPAASSNPEERP